MLYLLMSVGNDFYAVASSSVIEVVPCAALKVAPGAPSAVAGILNYRGRPVPVVDCGVLLVGRPCSVRYSTRIILQQFLLAGSDRILGLMGENVTRIQKFEESDFVEPGAHAVNFPCVGRVAALGDRWVQRLHAESILTPEVWDTLAAEVA